MEIIINAGVKHLLRQIGDPKLSRLIELEMKQIYMNGQIACIEDMVETFKQTEEG